MYCRDTVAGADDGLAAEKFGRPRQTNSGQPIADAEVVVIRRPARTILSRDFEVASEESEIHHSVVDFVEGSVIFKAQADVDGQRGGHTPIILGIGAEDVATAAKFGDASITAPASNKAKPKVRLSRTCTGRRTAYSAADIESSQGAEVSWVAVVQAFAPVLEADFEGVSAMSND